MWGRGRRRPKGVVRGRRSAVAKPSFVSTGTLAETETRRVFMRSVVVFDSSTWPLTQPCGALRFLWLGHAREGSFAYPFPAFRVAPVHKVHHNKHMT